MDIIQKSFRHSDGRWEAKYVEPQGKLLAGNLVQIAESFLLGKIFATKDEADKYTFNFLRERGIPMDEIETLD